VYQYADGYSPIFLRTASTPAIKVVATAPMPTTIVPSFPLGPRIILPYHGDLHLVANSNAVLIRRLR
jgi:hypothetical protein